MKQVNLIPMSMRERIVQRRRLRTWGLSLGLYAACLALASVAIRIGLLTGESNVSQQIEDEQAKMKLVQNEYIRDKALVSNLRRQIDSANATGRHPNWGLLLDLVSQGLNEQTVLDGVELIRTRIEPPKATPAKGDPAAKKAPVVARTEFTLALRGRSQSVEAMGHMLVEMEKCSVFRQVKLGDNRRVDSTTGSVIEFQVTCLLDSTEPTPSAGEPK